MAELNLSAMGLSWRRDVMSTPEVKAMLERAAQRSDSERDAEALMRLSLRAHEPVDMFWLTDARTGKPFK